MTRFISATRRWASLQSVGRESAATGKIGLHIYPRANWRPILNNTARHARVACAAVLLMASL